ncbi:MFS transporter [Pseudomonas sp. LP_7_YM]|uniref:MFS transporter n=1 Tax=Pseudomonas sp. LP_7_YM TaxID=2485137 RepID=UPI00106184B8|nr:MFS transporter [Pseudomonas sp. LP_7_YM]TDV72169.1 ACS family glucarate transporter-like MFS transporter [Pseudomonas sp. LP_7_YM]
MKAHTMGQVAAQTRSRARYTTLTMLVIASAVALADRANLSIAGSAMSAELGITALQLGYLFSAFSWAYVIAQLPAGWLLDRFGAIRVYGVALCLWSVVTLAQGFVGFGPTGWVIVTLFALRFLMGLVEAPLSPGNSSITASWFPVAERGTATSIYNSAQYVAVLVFVPFMGLLVGHVSWESVFWVMGALGVVLAAMWAKLMYVPTEHPGINDLELNHLREGGANVEGTTAPGAHQKVRLSDLKLFLSSRQMWGIYVGQYCLTSMQYFFLTWFPIYLVKGCGMNIVDVGIVAAIPAIAGFIGGILGGLLSDWLTRRGYSLSVARKAPFVTGMLLSSCVVLCNYVDSTCAVVALMTLALFGKGLGAVNFALIADTSPRHLVGFAGGLFNLFGSVSGIVTPIVIGYALQTTGSFTQALWFVALHGVVAAISYVLVVGKIKPLQPNIGT